MYEQLISRRPDLGYDISEIFDNNSRDEYKALIEVDWPTEDINNKKKLKSDISKTNAE